MIPEIPGSAVRLAAAGTGLEFMMDRHAYLALDAAVRAEVFRRLVDRRSTARPNSRMGPGWGGSR